MPPGRLVVADSDTPALDPREAALTEAYWKLREHASALRGTQVYRRAAERSEHEHGGRDHDRYRWLEATARGIEDGAEDIAEMLGVPEHEIERGDG